MSSIVKLLPGVVEEENGRLHVRGSEVQPQYVLDGIPIADNLSGIFATELDSDTLRTIQVITGNIPAQFGDKTSAIVNLSTKSGLNAPWNGKSTISGGSFGQADMSVSLGGSIGKFGVFAAADAGRSNRYMDPPDSGVEDDEEEALKGDDDAEDLGFHNKGGLVRLFTRFDWIPSERDAFHSTFSGSGTTFQIPNSLESHLMGQDQRQKLRDDFQSLTWTHVFGPKTVTDVAGSRRSSTARLVDPRHTGFPYFVAQERRQRTEGIRAKLSHEWRLGNIQFGGEAYRHPLQEHFRVAATDPELLEEIEEPIAQFTIDRPFRFDKKKTGSRSALYAELYELQARAYR